jgi:hypothetical protein
MLRSKKLHDIRGKPGRSELLIVAEISSVMVPTWLPMATLRPMATPQKFVSEKAAMQ